MFRRFRRQREPAATPPPPPPPPRKPPMLPAPGEGVAADDGFEDETPTTPLRAYRSGEPPPGGQTAARPAAALLHRQVDPEQVAHALEDYLNAPDWAASRQVVENHPELLTHTSLMLLRANMTRMAATVGPGAAQIVARYLQTLETAQREGVPFAFANTPDPHDAAFAPDLETLLEMLESPALAHDLARRSAIVQDALELASRDQHDELWASLQRELGLILPRLASPEHAANVDRAIEALDGALRIFTNFEYPADWAMTQHYLGLAFLARENGAKSANIESAVEAFEAALQVRTRDALPTDWAATQEALGSAFFYRLVGDRSENTDRAIACFEGALQVRSREKTPLEWATDQLSLGNAYGQRATGTRMGNIEQAITGFEAALTYFTPQNAPAQFALIHHNLGVAYMDRLFGSRGENIEHAIEHYRQAAAAQPRDRQPLEWADTCNNLGNAFRERISGDHDENIALAIAAYQDALRVRTREAFPVEHRRTARNLGTLLFELGRWSDAHDTLASALAASETLYLLGIGEGGPSQRLRDHADLVALDAVCLAKLDRAREAVVRLEAGRSRALDEMLERDRLALAAAPPAARLAFERAQASLLAAYDAAQALALRPPAPEPDDLAFGMMTRQMPLRERARAAVHQQRRAAQAELTAAVAAVRQVRPDFLHPPVTFDKIAAAPVAGQALVYLAVTPQGTLAAIVPAGLAEPGPDHLLWAPGLTTARLEKLTPRSADDASVVRTQLGLLPRPEALDSLLEALGRELMTPLALRLHHLGMRSVALLPGHRMATLPLHAAPIGSAVPTRDAEGEPDATRSDAVFLDAFEVVAIPSAQRLQAARGAASLVLRGGVAAVGNPQPGSLPLEWSEHEAEAVAQVAARTGQACSLLIRRQATAEAVTDAIRARAYVHLACASGFFPDRPLDSFVELAGGDMLTLADVLSGAAPMRGVRLLALSAGQSAMQPGSAADESVGMAAAMLVGGAAGVVASLWPASDLATLLLMRRFAQHYLSDEQPPAHALRNAQRWLRRLTLATLTRDFATDIARDPDLNLADFSLPKDCPYVHPLYWAGFMAFGA